MNNDRRIPLALAALALVCAMLFTSCGVVGDYAVRAYFEAGERVTLAADAPEDESDAPTAVESEGDTDEEPDINEATGGIRAPEVEGEASTPLMWRVVDEKTGGELYLLGSMHAGLDDMCLFADEVYEAFDSCRALAVESDIIEFENDASAAIEGLRLLVYTDGSKISDHIDRATYDAAAKILEENGYSRSNMNFYMPILWQQVIDEILTENTPYKYENGVDRYFISEAKRLGKRIYEIEDPLDTYRSLAALSERAQEILLEDEVAPEYVASFGDELASLYEMWKRGDLDEINAALLEDEGSAAERAAGSTDEVDADENAADTVDADAIDPEAERAACYEEYDRMMLGERNEGMIRKAREYLRRGIRIFYVVGLAHMLGDDGIVAGLAELGYTVELVEYGAN